MEKEGHSTMKPHSCYIYLQIQLNGGHYKIYSHRKKLTTPKKMHRINNLREANQKGGENPHH